MGPYRAERMVRLGSLKEAGVPYSVHSDYPMAPVHPLFLASVAVTRKSAQGTVLHPSEQIPAVQGLEAITVRAAQLIGQDDRIGTLREGYEADMVVLMADPLEVAAEEWPDIGIRGTFQDGTWFPTEVNDQWMAQTSPLWVPLSPEEAERLAIGLMPLGGRP